MKQSFYLPFCPLSPDSTLKMFSKESKTIQRSVSFSNMVSCCQNKNKIVENIPKATREMALNIRQCLSSSPAASIVLCVNNSAKWIETPLVLQGDGAHSANRVLHGCTSVLALFRVVLLSREELVRGSHEQRILPEQPWTAVGARITKLRLHPCAHTQHLLAAPKCSGAECLSGRRKPSTGSRIYARWIWAVLSREQLSQQPLTTVLPCFWNRTGREVWYLIPCAWAGLLPTVTFRALYRGKTRGYISLPHTFISAGPRRKPWRALTDPLAMAS